MENPKEEDTEKKVNAAAKYSAIGFQMIITIGLLTFIGYKIDEHRYGTEFCGAGKGVPGFRYYRLDF